MIMRREVTHRATTPDGQTLELAREAGHYVIRVAGVPLMSSATYGSEQAMARIAAERLGKRRAPKALVGGLGMGFTLRATLDVFAKDARVTVAELLPSVIEFSRGVLGPLANHPLTDRRVTLYEGDVRDLFQPNAWDVILLDVDNGPDAFTIAGNASLYGPAGLDRIRRSLTEGGVFVTWSAYQSPPFEARLRRSGFQTEALRVKARGEIRKGANHTLYVARAHGAPRKKR
jgi:spermidine synthase